jgi:hypothetical protein
VCAGRPMGAESGESVRAERREGGVGGDLAVGDRSRLASERATRVEAENGEARRGGRRGREQTGTGKRSRFCLIQPRRGEGGCRRRPYPFERFELVGGRVRATLAQPAQQQRPQSTVKPAPSDPCRPHQSPLQHGDRSRRALQHFELRSRRKPCPDTARPRREVKRQAPLQGSGKRRQRS